MNIDEIKSKLSYGDMRLAGQMIGISRDNAKVALKREGSKYHQAVKDALEKIISAREELLKDVKKKE